MPLTYRIDSDLDLIVTIGEGVVTLDEFRAYRAELMTDPQAHSGMQRLVDLRGVEQVAMPSTCVHTMVRKDGELVKRIGHTRTAMVVGSDETFGMARMYQAVSTSEEIEVFRDIADAREWLRLP